jgi:hypothetical protein
LTGMVDLVNPHGRLVFQQLRSAKGSKGLDF